MAASQLTKTTEAVESFLFRSPTLTETIVITMTADQAAAAQTLFDHHSVNCEITPVVVIDAASFADRWSTFETNPYDEQGLGELLAQVWGL